MAHVNYLQTHTGIQFPLFDPKPEHINIEDIAHHLSNQGRFNGATTDGPYSVAQHCVLVSYIIDPELALWGLLHDAAEAYVGDLISPLKALFPKFKEIENNILEVIAKKYDLIWPEPKDKIKPIDLKIRFTERRDLFAHSNHHWTGESAEAYPEQVDLWSPAHAKTRFLARFYELTANG